MAIVGMGGAVATTAIAGTELIKRGLAPKTGLPLAQLGPGLLVEYENLVFGGWDLYEADLLTAAREHGVLDDRQLQGIEDALSQLKPWPAAGNPAFCKNVRGEREHTPQPLRAQVEAIMADLRRFRLESGADAVVVIHLASTERPVEVANPVFQSLAAFEAGLDADDPAISPAILYAYAAIKSGCPHGNFTPSVAADVPALIQLAQDLGVPVAGKDGKTGQTLLKTVLAPALRARALKVDGWYSTNILGNRDGLALHDPDSLSSKINTKGSVLDDMLGYKVEDHIVQISYYKPRGDNKEAWDNVDVTGFLGQAMQIKVNFLCKDSILAAPLVLEIARVLDLAHTRGEGGIVGAMGTFFKAPMAVAGTFVEHALHRQELALAQWLAGVDTDQMSQVVDVADV